MKAGCGAEKETDHPTFQPKSLWSTDKKFMVKSLSQPTPLCGERQKDYTDKPLIATVVSELLF